MESWVDVILYKRVIQSSCCLLPRLCWQDMNPLMPLHCHLPFWISNPFILMSCKREERKRTGTGGGGVYNIDTVKPEWYRCLLKEHIATEYAGYLGQPSLRHAPSANPFLPPWRCQTNPFLFTYLRPTGCDNRRGGSCQGSPARVDFNQTSTDECTYNSLPWVVSVHPYLMSSVVAKSRAFCHAVNTNIWPCYLRQLTNK